MEILKDNLNNGENSDMIDNIVNMVKCQYDVSNGIFLREAYKHGYVYTPTKFLMSAISNEKPKLMIMFAVESNDFSNFVKLWPNISYRRRDKVLDLIAKLRRVKMSDYVVNYVDPHYQHECAHNNTRYARLIDSKRRLIMAMIRYGWTEYIKKYIDQGIIDEPGSVSLCYNRKHIVFDRGSESNYGSYMAMAAATGNMELVEYFYGLDPWPWADIMIGLDAAAWMGQTEAIRFFLDRGAQPTTSTLRLAIDSHVAIAVAIVIDYISQEGINDTLAGYLEDTKINRSIMMILVMRATNLNQSLIDAIDVHAVFWKIKMLVKFGATNHEDAIKFANDHGYFDMKSFNHFFNPLDPSKST